MDWLELALLLAVAGTGMAIILYLYNPECFKEIESIIAPDDSLVFLPIGR